MKTLIIALTLIAAPVAVRADCWSGNTTPGWTQDELTDKEPTAGSPGNMAALEMYTMVYNLFGSPRFSCFLDTSAGPQFPSVARCNSVDGKTQLLATLVSTNGDRVNHDIATRFRKTNGTWSNWNHAVYVNGPN